MIKSQKSSERSRKQSLLKIKNHSYKEMNVGKSVSNSEQQRSKSGIEVKNLKIYLLQVY